jgi:glycosyltransferase involved in cell wall biosynthesis
MYKLAICIPTYNRSEKVFKLVNDLLLTKFDWMQIVVSDNCSTDDTIAKLRQIVDPRLRLHENTKNEGAIANYLNAIGKSDAVYSLFLTDKDSINIDHLASVADALEKYMPVAGYIKYDVASPAKTRIAPESLKLFIAGYRCIHPSGYFFASTNLKDRLRDPSLRSALLGTSFPFELLLSSCSGDGDLAILQIPLITQESPAEYCAVKSHTYSATQGNLYFAPANRLATFSRFVDDINKNCAGKLDGRLTKIRLLYWFMSVSTLGYAKVTSDASFRDHYRIKEQEIYFPEILNTMRCYLSNISGMKNDRALLKVAFVLISAVILVKWLLWRVTKKRC